MTATGAISKNNVRTLAREAYKRHLISGYGDGEYHDQYQIVYQGKPRHLPLTQAYTFLKKLIASHPHSIHLSV